MAILVRTCCCGCDLRTGILLIGIFGLLSSGFSIYSGVYTYKILTDFENAGKPTLEVVPGKPTLEVVPVAVYKYFNVFINLTLAGIAFQAISTFVNLLLLGSYGTLNRYLALPWLIWQIFFLLYGFGVSIFFLAIWIGFSIFFVVNILGWLLWIYFVLVVYSYIESLRQDPFAFETGTMMQPPLYSKVP